MRPWLLVDIDGVLNLDPCRDGEGYPSVIQWARVGDHDLWLHQELPEWLQALSRVYDPVWCTTWEEEANSLLAPLLGLPSWPVLELRPTYLAPNAHWKRRAVERWLRAYPRPAAWLDDEFTAGDVAWGDHIGCRIVHCDPYVGLTAAMTAQLLQAVPKTV
jgi:hypothetical protein